MMSGKALDGRAALATPPANDEVEISIYGPGIGEAIALHAGDGKWVCIDSARYNGDCWQLTYFRLIGIDPNSAIAHIVASHWHTDHVDGLSDLVAACPSARFSCSGALNIEEFKQIYARFIGDNTERLRAPLREIRRIFELFMERRKKNTSCLAPQLLNAHQLADQWISPSGMRIQVWSLSPSPDDILRAKQEFTRLFVPPEEYAAGMSPIDENDSSVVLHVVIGSEHVTLLGSDLERTGSANTGWKAVVNSTLRPQEPVSVFKIPHHGSEGAFFQRVWDRMVRSDAIALLTPMTCNQLPTPDGIDLIGKQKRETYATALPKKTSVSRSRAATRVIERATHRSIQSYAMTGAGLVRLRKKLDGTSGWTVETFGSALRIV